MSSSSDRDGRTRVLFIAPQPFFVNRGTPLNVRAFVCRLAELGFDVHLLTFPFGEDVPLPGVTVHRCFRIPGLRRIAIGFSWNKLLYDIILLCYGVVLGIRHRIAIFHGVEEGGVLAGCLGMVFRRPYVMDMDSCIPEQLEKSALRRLPLLVRFLAGIENFFLRRATAIVTVCSSLTERARSVAWGVPVFQIEDFPLDSSCDVNAEHASTLAAELDIAGRPMILYTGNLEPYQGIDLLLESFGLLLRRAGREAPQPLLVLVGGDGERLRHYRDMIERCAMRDSVRCLGARPSEEMGTFMSMATVLASPRISGDNTPLKLYSYMISGRAIAATDIRSHTQALDAESAYLAAPDPASFAAALEAAVDLSPAAVELRDRMVRRSLHLVSTRFSKGAFERRVGELYGFLGGAETAAFRSPSRTIDGDDSERLVLAQDGAPLE